MRKKTCYLYFHELADFAMCIIKKAGRCKQSHKLQLEINLKQKTVCILECFQILYQKQFDAHLYVPSQLFNTPLHTYSTGRKVLVMSLFIITNSVVFFPFFFFLFYCFKCQQNVYKLSCKNFLAGSITHLNNQNQSIQIKIFSLKWQLLATQHTKRSQRRSEITYIHT